MDSERNVAKELGRAKYHFRSGMCSASVPPNKQKQYIHIHHVDFATIGT